MRSNHDAELGTMSDADDECTSADAAAAAAMAGGAATRRVKGKGLRQLRIAGRPCEIFVNEPSGGGIRPGLQYDRRTDNEAYSGS